MRGRLLSVTSTKSQSRLWVCIFVDWPGCSAKSQTRTDSFSKRSFVPTHSSSATNMFVLSMSYLLFCGASITEFGGTNPEDPFLVPCLRTTFNHFDPGFALSTFDRRILLNCKKLPR